MLFAVMFIAAQFSQKVLGNTSSGIQWFGAILTTMLSAVTFTIMELFVFPILSDSINLILAILFGVFSIGLLLSSILIMLRRRMRLHEYDTARFMTGLSLLVLSAIPLVISAVTGTTLWRISILLQVLAFVVFFLTSILSHRNDVISTRSAYIFAGLISMLPFLPLLVTISLNLMGPSTTSIDLGAYLIIHLTSFILTGILGGLVYNFSRLKPAKYHYPMVLVFGTWSLTELIQLSLVLFQGLSTTDSRTMLTLGSIVTVVLLMVAVAWTIKPDSNSSTASIRKIIFTLTGIGVILGGGWYLVFWLTQGVVVIGNGSALIGLSLVAIFFVTFLFLLQLYDSDGHMSVEAISIGYLAAWIAPNVLRGFFEYYTYGWWIGEIMFLVGLLFVPGVLAIQYLSSLRVAETAKLQAQASHQDATLYADVLGHDISNLHQAIATSLGILEMGEIDGEIRERAITTAQTSLDRANQLVHSVRQLGLIRQMGPDAFKKMDLVHCIMLAFEDVCEESGEKLPINKTVGECYVMASPLLDVMFVNLFRNTIQSADVEKRVRVEINETVEDCGACWNMQFIIEQFVVKPEEKATIFDSAEGGARGSGLGFAVVRALAESFGGYVDVHDLVSSDYTQGTVFVVNLPACKESAE